MATGCGKGDRGKEGARDLSRFWIFKHELSRINHEFLLLLYKKMDKKVKMADNLGPNGLVVSAGK